MGTALDKKKDDESHKIPCAGVKDGNVMFEQIFDNGRPLYAIRFTDGSIETRDFYGDYRLLEPKEIPWEYRYGRPKDYKTIKALYDELKDFISHYVYLPEPELYDVVVNFIMATYRYEDFDFATYFTLLGPIKSGKTRLLQILEMLCYRGFKTSSISPAAIARLIENYRVTLLLDETDKVATEFRSDVMAILNEGQKKPSRYVRAQKEGEGIEIRDVWGFKAMAGTEKFFRSVASRSIEFHMRKPGRRMPKITNETKAKAQELRDKLLMFRLRQEPLNNFNDSFLNDDRTSEIFYPLFALSPYPEVLKKYALHVEGIEIEEEKSSIEARVFKAILDCYKEGKIVSGKIKITDITDSFNADLDDKEKFTNDSIGRICARLGFQKARIGDRGLRGIRWDNELVKELTIRYLDQDSLAFFIPKKASDVSVSSVSEEIIKVSVDKDQCQPVSSLKATTDTFDAKTGVVNQDTNLFTCKSCGCKFISGSDLKAHFDAIHAGSDKT